MTERGVHWLTNVILVAIVLALAIGGFLIVRQPSYVKHSVVGSDIQG